MRWSGRRVAFASIATAIVVVGPAIGSPLRAWATFPGGHNGVIAVVRPSPSGGTGTDIWTVGPQGAHILQLTSNGNNAHPRWSPDGKHIAYDSLRYVWTMNADGSNPLPVTTGSTPSWSPDGKWLAYVGIFPTKCQCVSGVLKIRAQAPFGQPIPLSKPTVNINEHDSDSYPAWSPNGKSIAFVRLFFNNNATDYATQLWTVDPKTRANRFLYVDPVCKGNFSDYATPSWGPSGKNLLFAYNSICTSSVDVFQLTVATSTATKLVPNGDSGVLSPHLGQLLAYAIKDVTSGQSNTFIANADGSAATPLLSNASQPDWQPLP